VVWVPWGDGPFRSGGDAFAARGGRWRFAHHTRRRDWTPELGSRVPVLGHLMEDGCARRRARTIQPRARRSESAGHRWDGRGGGRHKSYADRASGANWAALFRPPTRPANWRLPLTPRSRFAERGAGLWSAPLRASGRGLVSIALACALHVVSPLFQPPRLHHLPCISSRAL